MVTLQLHRILLLQVRGLLEESLCLFYPFLEQVKGRWLTSFLSTYFMRQGDGVATSGNANIATRAYRLDTCLWVTMRERLLPSVTSEVQ
jgi:hypothetical protein